MKIWPNRRKRRSQRGKPRAPSTVQLYMRAVIAALNWAHKPIEFDVMAVDEDELSKRRSITTGMLAVTPKVVGEEQASVWVFLLRDLWETGVRLGEAMNTTWDKSGTITPNWTSSGDVLLRFPAKRQKNRKNT